MCAASVHISRLVRFRDIALLNEMYKFSSLVSHHAVALYK